ncbi:hypothetical protein GJAV_G00003340, partial [Gymnothorax javanicus]
RKYEGWRSQARGRGLQTVFECFSFVYSSNDQLPILSTLFCLTLYLFLYLLLSLFFLPSISFAYYLFLSLCPLPSLLSFSSSLFHSPSNSFPLSMFHPVCLYMNPLTPTYYSPFFQFYAFSQWRMDGQVNPMEEKMNGEGGKGRGGRERRRREEEGEIWSVECRGIEGSCWARSKELGHCVHRTMGATAENCGTGGIFIGTSLSCCSPPTHHR